MLAARELVEEGEEVNNWEVGVVGVGAEGSGAIREAVP